ncbi:MAG: glutamate synthase large subunit [Cyclobacteriaceae bacterium]|nr:glutamate synthase large subunit [Cyclobacteriaceae bacterium HetDA_MAG_MS6]
MKSVTREISKKTKTLYTPELEHDSCGVGCVVNINGRKSHKTVKDALTMLKNMEHRGATGSDPETGDGAGVLIQIPHPFFKQELREFGMNLPDEGHYGVGMVFYPNHYNTREDCRKVMNSCMRKMGFQLIGYRLVPVNSSVPGHESKSVEPYIEQVFIQHKNPDVQGDELERKLFVLSNFISHQVKQQVRGQNDEFYLASFSSRTIIYKGQLKTNQLEKYYHDLENAELKSALAIVHSRFSTNTFPNWRLAQPFRFIAHNGEINTIRGNVNKMQSKEALMSSPLYSKEELSWLLPVTDPSNSDSANLDALVELLTLSGRSLPHVMMMLVPEAWQDNERMKPLRKAFYKYHAAMMEPWDGPAALFFTNGTQIGATLDRNGLRPVRFCVTSDNRLIMASEAGAVPVKEENIVRKGRLQPGKMLMADLEEQKAYSDNEIKKKVYENKPYFDWIKDKRIKLRMQPIPDLEDKVIEPKRLQTRQISSGITEEDVKHIIQPLSVLGGEPIGSMGADIPLAVLSRQSQHVANYFKQYFAQVSNPPIDPIRERLVMSLFTRIGESQNLLDETPEHTRQVHISQPILSREDFYRIKALATTENLDHYIVDATFDAVGGERLEDAIERICREAEESIEKGYSILIISNRKETPDRAPIPGLLAVGAIHHHLVDKKLRTKSGLIVECSDAWETHHFATMIGYGASGIYPYLVYDTIKNAYNHNDLDNSISLQEYYSRYIKGVGKGLLKILSKMGISTLQSYQAAQIFECIGLGQEVISKCFKGTISRLDGLTFDDLEKETLVKHHAAYADENKKLLEVGGVYQWKHKGEKHLLNPKTIHLLQKSTSLEDYSLFKEFTNSINDGRSDIITIRDLFEFKKRRSIPIEEVEPAENILRRFATGAMSFGSISHEAHSTLAIAMNRIGAKSNSGEGGEDESRFIKKTNGDWERSAIKQAASGRFGVTINYLNNADELQIKIAQGAKPGEGGQLPGHKVDDWIARVRNSTPGVGLISPPPHHDIYSIEDLKQLIFDLKNSNPDARINVKLVSEAGVGTIAAGVAKAKADVILVSGADGGTGASPLSSIRHAGLPWEMGLAEAHQTLLRNNLRSRVVLQTDGKLMTGRDIAIATLLGAEEWGISTAALIVEGCIMMRKCHLNTCPVGIATQKPELRKLFTGNPDHVVTFFKFITEELREIMAELGFRTINEMVGQSSVLKLRSDIDHWKVDRLDLTPILQYEQLPSHIGTYRQFDQDHELDKVLDNKIIRDIKPSGAYKELSYSIKNIDRSTGTLLSSYLTKNKKVFGEPLKVNFRGSAGQSFGAFLAPSVQFKLEGEANDYVAKGLSGGKIIIKPDLTSKLVPEENIIIGNVSLYGATSGEVYINGQAGERFCVRNSGAEAVVEGIGDHGCEYMTGGLAVILGDVGNNFGAGMSGGIAYVLDSNKKFEKRCNLEMIGLEALDTNDVELVKGKVENHLDFTGSPLAKRLLDDWKNTITQFVKVMPHDLKRVLESKKQKNQVA